MNDEDASQTPPSKPHFYSDAAGDPERFKLALAVEGLDEEIALLRVGLEDLMGQEPVDYRLVMQVMNTLVRAAAAQYRLSPKARKDLAGNIAAVLNSLGDQLLPADR